MTLLILLYFVQPAGETFTPAEQAQAISAVQDAADWWGMHTEIKRMGVLETDSDIYTTWQSLPSGDDTTVHVYIVDNSTTHSPLMNGAQRSLGIGTPHTVFAVNVTGGWLVAHEIGHAVYDLPHVSDAGIMDTAGVFDAYEHGAVGCASLARLGTPCKATYLPLLGINMIAMAKSSTAINTPN